MGQYIVGTDRMKAQDLYKKILEGWQKDLTGGDMKNNLYLFPYKRCCLIQSMIVNCDQDLFLKIFDSVKIVSVCFDIVKGEDGLIGGEEWLAAIQAEEEKTPQVETVLHELGKSFGLLKFDTSADPVIHGVAKIW
jgi:hypothetical protein